MRGRAGTVCQECPYRFGYFSEQVVLPAAIYYGRQQVEGDRSNGKGCIGLAMAPHVAAPMVLHARAIIDGTHYALAVSGCFWQVLNELGRNLQPFIRVDRH
jgi:hypothetical protein